MIACSRSRRMAPITAALIYVEQPVRNRFHGVALPGRPICSGADRLTQLHIETQRPTRWRRPRLTAVPGCDGHIYTDDTPERREYRLNRRNIHDNTTCSLSLATRHAHTRVVLPYVYQGLAWLRTDRGATEGSDGETAAPKRVSTRARAQQDNRRPPARPETPGRVAAATPSRHRRADRLSHPYLVE